MLKETCDVLLDKIIELLLDFLEFWDTKISLNLSNDIYVHFLYALICYSVA